MALAPHAVAVAKVAAKVGQVALQATLGVVAARALPRVVAAQQLSRAARVVLAQVLALAKLAGHADRA